MSNTPTITQLGDLNGVLPYQTLGISIKKDGGVWIGFIVAGQGSITSNEAFGLVLVEAMACGKPLVACNLQSGVPYVCLNEVNGLTCQPAESGALSRAVNRILFDPELAARLGQAGLKRAQTEFSASLMVNRTLALFSSLTERAPRT